jgi:hypothetical protein
MEIKEVNGNQGNGKGKGISIQRSAYSISEINICCVGYREEETFPKINS